MTEVARRVVCAAVLYPGFPVILGIRHYDMIMVEQISLMKIPEELQPNAVQGFVDNHGNFLTREEAYVLAMEQSQIYRPLPYQTTLLYSEMLY